MLHGKLAFTLQQGSFNFDTVFNSYCLRLTPEIQPLVAATGKNTMKHTLPVNSKPRPDPFGCQKKLYCHYTSNPGLDIISLDLVAMLPWARSTFGLCLMTLPPAVRAALHTLWFSSCIFHVLRDPSKNTHPCTPDLNFPKFGFIIEMKELNLCGSVEVWEVHETRNVNVHAATMRPATKSTDLCKHLNTQLPPATPAVDWSPFPFT